MNILTRVLAFALVASPMAVSADDTHKHGDTKTGDTSKPADAPKKTAKLTADELQVLAHYHEVNMMEVDLGKAAQKLGTSEAVKQYGAMMVKDHTDNDKKIMALAKKTGQMVPKEKPASEAEKIEKAEAKAAATKLKTLKGADFDREYLRMMVQDHEKELAKIDGNMARVQHPEVSDHLKATKPALQAHADQARELQKNEAQASR